MRRQAIENKKYSGELMYDVYASDREAHVVIGGMIHTCYISKPMAAAGCSRVVVKFHNQKLWIVGMYGGSAEVIAEEVC